jgi:acyl carrier protein
VAERAPIAVAVYGILESRWPGRFASAQLQDHVSLGGDGLGLDSIEIVELLLDCEERLDGGARTDPDELFEEGPISIGRLIDHLTHA